MWLNMFYKCGFNNCRLDMTQELLDYMDAGLKMAETGESFNSWCNPLKSSQQFVTSCLLKDKTGNI